MSTETEAKRSSRSAAAIAVLVTLLGGLWLCAATWSGAQPWRPLARRSASARAASSAATTSRPAGLQGSV